MNTDAFQFLRDRGFQQDIIDSNNNNRLRLVQISNSHDPPPTSVSQSELQMGDSEKVMELKKAYVAIMLNMEKEAAVRVMVAERKALRCQREVAYCKEDAVRMMVRLKHMMDSRIDEANKRQQSKIDELEAQLQEAEDIVKNLREELAILKDELHAIRKHRSQQTCEQQASHIANLGQKEQGEGIASPISVCNHNQVSNVAAIHVVTSELENLFDQRISESIRDDHCETPHISNLDMAPNSTMVKEHELSENGSFQILHQVTDEDISINDIIHGKRQIVKHHSIVREDFENSGKSVSLTSSAEVHDPEGMSRNQVKRVWEINKDFYRAMKIKARSHSIKKNKTQSLRKCQSLAKKILKSLQKTNLVTSETYPLSVVSYAVRETDDQKDQGLCVSTIELHSNSELGRPIQPCSLSTPEIDKAKMGKASIGEENGSAESSVTCADSEIACVPSSTIIEESDELDADDAFQPKTDRSIQYTFQRKRKKECTGSADENDIAVVKRSSDGDPLSRPTNIESNTNGLFNGSFQPSENKENFLKEFKRSLKRKNIDMLDCKTSKKQMDVEMPADSEPKVIGIVPKATRDSRRLGQVARQLLSMSEKKCWD